MTPITTSLGWAATGDVMKGRRNIASESSTRPRFMAGSSSSERVGSRPILLTRCVDCQGPVAGRSVSVRNYGDPIAADPPGGWGGWGLGKPDRAVWPPPRPLGAGPPGPTYHHGLSKAPPPPPPPPP